MKALNFLKRAYEKLKLKNIAITAVIVAQALKRAAQSEITLLILELAPLPWANFIGKIFGWINKANDVVPEIVKSIVVSKGILDSTDDLPANQAMAILIDHLRYYKKEDLNEFVKFFSVQIVNANYDGVITDEEKDQIIEESYQFLFKRK